MRHTARPSATAQSAPSPPAGGGRGMLVLTLRDVAIGLSAFYIALYVVIACLRLRYPFELEWVEGSSLDHVRRILAGQKLYVAPSFEFTPHVYTPLYFYASALVARLMGVGFVPLRLVSFASSLGCFALVFLMVKRETRSSIAAMCGVGLFAACYRVSGAWFDIGRVDTLALFLLLGGFYLLQRGGAVTVHLAAGVLITLSFLTKQISLASALPPLLVCAWRGRRGWVAAATTLVLSGGLTWLLNDIHHGWYDFYLFRVPAHHPVVPENIAGFWIKDLGWQVPVALAAAVYFLVVQFKRRGERRWFWAAVAAGTVGGAWVLRIHEGGYNNVLMPAYAVMAALAAMGGYAIVAAAQDKSAAVSASAQIAVYVLCIAQLGRLYYDPVRQVPTARDREANERLVAMMRGIAGDVYVPYHPYLAGLAGKPILADAAAISAVTQAGYEELNARLDQQFLEALRERRFGAVITDTYNPNWGQPDLGAYYWGQRLHLAEDVLWPVTGLMTRPQYLYLPKRPPRRHQDTR